MVPWLLAVTVDKNPDRHNPKIAREYMLAGLEWKVRMICCVGNKRQTYYELECSGIRRLGGWLWMKDDVSREANYQLFISFFLLSCTISVHHHSEGPRRGNERDSVEKANGSVNHY